MRLFNKLLTRDIHHDIVLHRNHMPMNLPLKIAILESGLSQLEVAKAADMHESRMSHLVNGHREPSDAERKALARILKRKVSDLFPLAIAS